MLLLAASQSAVAQDDYSAVEERIRALAPNVKSVAISETPIEGILMAQIQGDIVYVTSDGQYLIQGRVINRTICPVCKIQSGDLIIIEIVKICINGSQLINFSKPRLPYR